MKKRAVEAVIILALVAALFIGVNFIFGSVSGNTRKIDGEFFNIGERELILCLMSEEGVEQLEDFSRLEALTLTPYKYAAARALEMGDAEYDAAVYKKAEVAYSECTDLSDLSFIAPLTGLKRLDVSYCGVSDISFISGMSELEELDISHTNITDLSPLLELSSLKNLTADYELSGDITDKLSDRGVSVIFPDKPKE